MAVVKRSGKYGTYYGSNTDSSGYPTDSQIKTNVKYIYTYLTNAGWTINAIAGLLGNVQNESAVNPGRWQSEKVGVSSMGYGLIQWTPSTVHTGWCKSNGYKDYSTMDANLAHLVYEANNNSSWYKKLNYTETYKQFIQSTKDPYYLACCFAWNRERSAVVLWGTEAEQEALRNKRGNSANTWFTFLGGVQIVTPGTFIYYNDKWCSCNTWVTVKEDKKIVWKLTENSAEPSIINTADEFAWPVPDSGTITSGFGPRWGGTHSGIDISCGVSASYSGPTYQKINGTTYPIYTLTNPLKTKVIAMRDGTVTDVVKICTHNYKKRGSNDDTSMPPSCGCGGGYGNRIYVDHGKIGEDNYSTRYAHLTSVLVKKGDTVKKGQVIGYMGCTGHSTGIHLHFEIRKNGTAINPCTLVSYK